MCQHRCRPSHCFVLIKQSGSPCPYQFVFNFSVRCGTTAEAASLQVVHPPTVQARPATRVASQSQPLAVLHDLSHKRQVARASPFPEVTDLICRLPFPTLSHSPGPVKAANLLRLWVRTLHNEHASPGFSRSG